MRRLTLLPAVVAAAALVAVPGTATAGAMAASPAVGGDLLATHATVVTPGATPFPHVAAASFVVADATTGVVLAARDPHAPHFPASTLKTLTALTVLPLLDKRTVYVARPQDSNAEGSRVGMVAGAPYTVDDLFHGLFLPSGNDAASGLANAAGGWAVTVAAMNRTARQLQADDTHVVNPSGLDAVGQVSSAYDLALVARAGLARADFRRYTTTKRYAFPGKAAKPGARRSTYEIQNQNKLLMHDYPGAVGVKTGYTTLAGRTYVGAAERHGHLLIVTIMRIGEASETAADTLLDWGFRNVGRPGVGTLVDALPSTTAGGTQSPAPTSSVLAAAGRSAALTGTGSGRAVDPRLGVGLGAGVVAVGLVGVGAAVRRRRKH